MSDETPTDASPGPSSEPATPAEPAAAAPAAPPPAEPAPAPVPAATAEPTEPEIPATPATAPVADAAPPAPAEPAKARKAVAVPMWLLVSIAALVGAVVMFGIGYAVGESGNDDDAVSTQPGFQIPNNPFGGNGDGNQAPQMPGRPNAPQTPQTPNAPQTPGRGSAAFLGVATRAVDGGLEVTQVVAGSAADDAGLEVGDVITEFDGNAVSTPAQLATAVAGLDPGDEVKLTYRRDGRSRTVTVELGTRGSTSS